MTTIRFDFENRKPYQAALELNRLAIQVCSRTAADHPLLTNELRRSAMKLVQYLALNYGLTDTNAKKQALSNAIGAVNRVMSVLLIVQQHGLLGEDELIPARHFCEQIRRLR